MLILCDNDKPRKLPHYVGGDPVLIAQIWDDEFPDADIVVMDIDFLDLKTVSRTREFLGKGKKPALLAAVADPANHRARTQAWALGATRLLPAPLSTPGLTQLIRSAAANDPAMIQCQTSVMYAAGALELAFSALHSHSLLDIGQIDKSGGEISNAIARSSLESWLGTVRAYHEGTFQHCLIVTGLATAFGYHTGMARADITTLATAALLHDIGKIEIPATILDKPDKLSEAELALVRSHPAIGHEYLSTQKGVAPEILAAVRHHHEYLDGSGYPDGLKGSEIGDVTRILTVCDIYGALVETRPYKLAAAPHEAIDILSGMADEGKVERVLVNVLAEAVNTHAA